MERVLQGAVSTVLEVMEVEVALIYGLERSSNNLRLLAYEGVSEDFARTFGSVRLDEGYLGKAAREARCVIVENASREPGPGQVVMKTMRIQAQLMMPLRARGTIVGVLCVASRRPRIFQADEIEILEVIGDEVGVAIDNARLYQDQKRVAEALSVSERAYRSLFEKAHDAIWFHDLDGNTTAINKAASGLTGYSQKDAVGLPVTRLLCPDSLKLAREVKRRLLADQDFIQPYEQQLIRIDGSIASVMLTTSLTMSEGQPTGFQHIARDVTIEKRMQENLRYYINQVTRVQEDERKRIARELHDDTCQSLYAISRQMDNYLRDNKSITDHNAVFLQEVLRQITEVLGGVRRFSQDLRPSVLDDLGLLPALHWLVHETERTYGLSGSLVITGDIRRFTPEAEVSLFRVVQEGLNNAGKHARAGKISVELDFKYDTATIIIKDDGQGFDPPSAISDLTRNGKLGLAGMEERVLLLGGQIIIKSELGRGTEIKVKVPFGQSSVSQPPE
jgi:PAS domain S-box-containing protein